MHSFQLGQTSEGLPILAHTFGRQGPKVLILGGIHGNEPEGVVACYGLLKRFQEGFTQKLQVTLVPTFNLDGVLRCERTNARGVDLNRNLPTQDWSAEVAQPKYNPGPEPCSESENKGLVQWLQKETPQLIFSLHSWKPLLNVNGACDPEAEVIHKLTGYEIYKDIGYPTPGCLGTYCGLERNIPTLTYEIERGLDPVSVLKIHVPAIQESLKKTEDRF